MSFEKAVATIRQLVKDRNLEIVDDHVDASTDMKLMLHAQSTDSSHRLIVFFPREDKLSIRTKRTIVKKVAKLASSGWTCNTIVVTEHGSTPFAWKEIETDPSMELFLYKELVISPVMHRLVPEHVKATPSEIKALRLTSDADLPKIMKDDAIVKYLGLVRGDIVRIKRTAIEGNTYYFYRLVV